MKSTPKVISVTPVIKLYDNEFRNNANSKQNIQEKYTMLYALKPLHILLRFFAMSRVPYSNNLIKRLHVFIMITILSILVFGTIKWRTNMVYIKMTSVLNTTDVMALLMLAATSYCNLLVVGFQSPYIQTIYKNHAIMDSMLDLDKDFKYRKGRTVVIKILLSFLIPLLLISSFDLYANVVSYDFWRAALYFLNYVLYSVNSLVIIQFVIAMYSVRVQFLVINIQMQIFTDKKLNRANFDENSEEYRKYYNPSIIETIVFNVKLLIEFAQNGIKGLELNINKITSIYMLNCDQCDLYNTYFSIQNFLATVNSIVSILKSLHMVSVYVSNREENFLSGNDFYLMLATLGFALFDIFILFIISNSCENVVNEAKKTSLIMDAMIYKKAFKNLDDITICSQLVARRMPRFTALGFFDMDFNLLSTIAGTIATYLIMLIQMKS